MALHLIAMKLNGFTDAEPAPQGLEIEGSAIFIIHGFN